MGEHRSGPALLVFADDWGRHPSSCQHLMRHLLGRYPVIWVNTIGMRAPRLNRDTLSRGLEKVRHWTRRRPPAQPLPEGLRVLNPWMWPWFRSTFDRWLNRELLLRQLLPVVCALPEPPVAITTLPIVADLVGVLPARHWVYYCVDDFGTWPGLDQGPLQCLEARLVMRANRFIAVSETLQANLAQRGRGARLLSHGVDLDFWRSPTAKLPPDFLAGRERPLVVFWGVIDRRMDTAWVAQLASELTRGTIVLVGPEADPDPELLACPRVQRLPALPFEQLPALAREAAVLVMPYADLPVTQAMQPLKLKEYLATGLPVVVRNLPANRTWGDCLDLADTPADFALRVLWRLETGLPAEQRQARTRLESESWTEKARWFERWAIDDPPLASGAHELPAGGKPQGFHLPARQRTKGAQRLPGPMRSETP